MTSRLPTRTKAMDCRVFCQSACKVRARGHLQPPGFWHSCHTSWYLAPAFQLEGIRDAAGVVVATGDLDKHILQFNAGTTLSGLCPHLEGKPSSVVGGSTSHRPSTEGTRTRETITTKTHAVGANICLTCGISSSAKGSRPQHRTTPPVSAMAVCWRAQANASADTETVVSSTSKYSAPWSPTATSIE